MAVFRTVDQLRITYRSRTIPPHLRSLLRTGPSALPVWSHHPLNCILVSSSRRNNHHLDSASPSPPTSPSTSLVTLSTAVSSTDTFLRIASDVEGHQRSRFETTSVMNISQLWATSKEACYRVVNGISDLFRGIFLGPPATSPVVDGPVAERGAGLFEIWYCSLAATTRSYVLERFYQPYLQPAVPIRDFINTMRHLGLDEQRRVH